jgi:hypothetical protein
MEPDTHTTRWALPLGEGGDLKVEADVAHLCFRPVPPDREPYVFCAVPESDAPHVGIEAGHGGTRVTVGGLARPWRLWRERRPTQVVFCVPQGLRLRVQTDSARIEVRGLAVAELDVQVDTGDVQLDDVVGRIKVGSDAGRIVAQDIAGSFDIRTDTGMIQVRALRLDAGVSRVVTDMGAIEVELPAGLPVRVKAKAKLGSVRNQIPAYRDAPATLIAKSSLGMVRITELSRPPSAETGGAGGPYRTPGPVSGPVEAPIPAPTGEQEAPGDEIDRIVQLVAAGKLSAKDAEQLLAELEG